MWAASAVERQLTVQRGDTVPMRLCSILALQFFPAALPLSKSLHCRVAKSSSAILSQVSVFRYVTDLLLVDQPFSHGGREPFIGHVTLATW